MKTIKRNRKAIKLIEGWIKEDCKNSKVVLETWGRLKKRLTEQGFTALVKMLEPGNFKQRCEE